MDPHITSLHQFPSILDPDQFAGRKIRTVETSIDLHRTTEPSRSIDQFSIYFNRSDQDGCGEFLPLSHNIQTMVHPIDEVDVGNPSWTKHDIRSLRSPFRRMAGFVLQSYIGLHFDDFTRECTAIEGPNEILSNQ